MPLDLEDGRVKLARLNQLKFLLKFPTTDPNLRPYLEAIIEMYDEHIHGKKDKIVLEYSIKESPRCERRR